MISLKAIFTSGRKLSLLLLILALPLAFVHAESYRVGFYFSGDDSEFERDVRDSLALAASEVDSPVLLSKRIAREMGRNEVEWRKSENERILKEGKISKIYPQYNQIELNLAKGEFPMNAGIFYEFDSNVYFQEVTTDSVFQVTDEVLVPHICFKHPKEISSPGVLGETARFVVSRYYVKGHKHIAIYDKNKKTTYVDFVFEKSSDQALFEKAVSYRMSQNGELIFLLQPTDIIEYLEAHPEKEEELDKRLVHLMEDDNPIVMVLKIRDM